MYEHERRSRAHYESRAPLYDWANRVAALLRGTRAMQERRKAVDRLEVGRGARVLEVSIGTGTNAFLLRERLGSNGRIVGLDLSRAMLRKCAHKVARRGIAVELVEGEASSLPFAADTFDAVLHHGGLAEFGNPKGAIAEMMRVARPGAKVVICDVGVPEDRPLSLVNRLLLRLQPEYDKPPPMGLLPAEARRATLAWFHRGSWYMIEFSKQEA